MQILATVDFGRLYTGAAVYYQILAADKSVVVARTNSGVTEIAPGTGIYGVSIDTDTVAGRLIVWDVNGTSAVAVDDLGSEILSARMVPVDSFLVVPPSHQSGQTTAWVYCVSKGGTPQSGIPITIRAVGVGSAASVAIESGVVSAVSDAAGLATLLIPRVAGMRFAVRRGVGEWIPFSGVDADTLQLPAMIG